MCLLMRKRRLIILSRTFVHPEFERHRRGRRYVRKGGCSFGSIVLQGGQILALPCGFLPLMAVSSSSLEALAASAQCSSAIPSI